MVQLDNNYNIILNSNSTSQQQKPNSIIHAQYQRHIFMTKIEKACRRFFDEALMNLGVIHRMKFIQEYLLFLYTTYNCNQATRLLNNQVLQPNYTAAH